MKINKPTAIALCVASVLIAVTVIYKTIQGQQYIKAPPITGGSVGPMPGPKPAGAKTK